MSSPEKTRAGGRPKTFQEEAARPNLHLPARLMRAVHLRALDQRKTCGEVVTEILERCLV